MSTSPEMSPRELRPSKSQPANERRAPSHTTSVPSPLDTASGVSGHELGTDPSTPRVSMAQSRETETRVERELKDTGGAPASDGREKESVPPGLRVVQSALWGSLAILSATYLQNYWLAALDLAICIGYGVAAYVGYRAQGSRRDSEQSPPSPKENGS